MPEEIEFQEYRDFESTPDRIITINLDSYFKRFFTQNIYGVCMGTFKELSEIELAAKKIALLWSELWADKKITFPELGEHVPELIDIFGAVKDAVTLDSPVILSSLLEGEAETLIVGGIDIIFTAAGVQPSGTQTATYKEIKEIFDAGDAIAKLISAFAEDGKISWTDFVANLSDEIALSPIIQAAVKIDGTVNIGDLTTEQIHELVSMLYKDILLMVEAIQKLKGV